MEQPAQRPEAAPTPTRGRFQQADREALLTLGLYAAYFVWWYGFAYGLGGGDPADYTYVFGFPAWFFYSCIAGYPVLTLALWLVVRYCFRDMPIDDVSPAATPADTADPHMTDVPQPAPGTPEQAPDRTTGPII